MSATKTPSKKAAEIDDEPVIDLPKNYRGQKLHGSVISVAPEYSANREFYAPLLTFLLKQFAAEVSARKTAWSKRYLDGLNTGQGFFWNHDDFPEICLVSLAQSDDGSANRLLVFMTHERMIEDFFTPAKPATKAKRKSSQSAAQAMTEPAPEGAIIY